MCVSAFLFLCFLVSFLKKFVLVLLVHFSACLSVFLRKIEKKHGGERVGRYGGSMGR